MRQPNEAEGKTGLPTPLISRHAFRGKDGSVYSVNYYNIPGKPRDENRNNLEDLRLGIPEDALSRLIADTFPNYNEGGIASTVKKIAESSRFAIAFNAEHEPVAFNVYRVGTVDTKAGTAKTIYVDHAGTHPNYRNAGITSETRKEFYRRENPDVICGSSANGVIYITNKGIAAQLGMDFYPTDANTPTTIVELANQIHDELGLRNAELADTLVRTYPDATSRGEIPHPLSEVLPLEETQHIFYMLVKPELKQQLVAA